jgi:hypothetical protein
MIQLIATKPFTYLNRALKAGDPFEVGTEREARVRVLALRQARRAQPAPMERAPIRKRPAPAKIESAQEAITEPKAEPEPISDPGSAPVAVAVAVAPAAEVEPSISQKAQKADPAPAAGTPAADPEITGVSAATEETTG